MKKMMFLGCVWFLITNHKTTNDHGTILEWCKKNKTKMRQGKMENLMRNGEERLFGVHFLILKTIAAITM